MTETKTINRQPGGSQLDYLDPTKFVFQIAKLPKVQFNTVIANIPGVTLTELNQPTRLHTVKLPGNDLTFEDLTIQFIVDEDMNNYIAVHDWMAGLAQVDSDDKFRALMSDGQDRMPRSEQNTKGATNDSAIFSDAKLIVLSNRNIPSIEVSFQDTYPKSLSAIDFNQQNTDVEYVIATLTLGYKLHTYTRPF
tara:strand:+ start:193 stop:771 length:579 start_codon:yes stop_codon:yes gene_type:complete